MRRLAGALAALLLIAPAGLRLAAADADAEALRCAIACGHAVKAGAACCPMAGESKGVAMAACPEGDTQAAIPLLAAPLAILTVSSEPTAPEGSSSLSASSSDAVRDGIARAPEHVPILPS